MPLSIYTRQTTNIQSHSIPEISCGFQNLENGAFDPDNIFSPQSILRVGQAVPPSMYRQIWKIQAKRLLN